MNYKPTKYTLGDTWHLSDGERIHTFYMQNIAFDNTDDPESGSLGHAVSEDMIHWEELKPAIYRGGAGSYDEMDLWTGCTYIYNGKWYLYYTSRPKNDCLANSICLATSEDGINFTKHPENPIITPDERYYYSAQNKPSLAVHSNNDGTLLDCRDLCVVRDEEKNVWWGFFAVRRPAKECTETSVIGLARSEDLVHWEQLEPCYCPDKYGCIETPDVFEIDGKWYMLCLSGNDYGQRNRSGDPNLTGRITVWAVADKIEGPYREICRDNVILGAMDFDGICAKTAMYKGKRYLFYTQAMSCEDGNLITSKSLPKEIVADKDSRLWLKWFDGVEKLYSKALPLTEDKAIENSGRWGSICEWTFAENTVNAYPRHDWCVKMFDIEAENYVLETKLHRGDCIAAGVIFDVVGDDIYSDNKIAMIDFEENEVWLTHARNFKKDAARRIKLCGDEFTLKVLCFGTAVEVYVNDELFVHHQYNRNGGKIGLFADAGKVTFRDSIVNIIDWESK